MCNDSPYSWLKPHNIIVIWSAFVLFGHMDISYSAPGTLQGDSMVIVAVNIDGENFGDWDLYVNGNDYWVPGEKLEKHFSISFTDLPNEKLLSTPLGNITIALSDTAVDTKSAVFLSTETLSEKLKIQSQFDSQEYTLSFSVPWKNRMITAQGSPDTIDYTAPGSSISTFRLQNSLLHNDSIRNSESEVMATGSAGPGVWLLNLSDENRENFIPVHYHWTASSKNHILRLGTNTAKLSSLLPQLDFTGVQYATSNKGISKYAQLSTDLNFDNFLTDNFDLLKTITRNDGPPAGIAELRINDSRAAMVRIGLDGHYEFSNIVYDNNQHQIVDIYLYESTVTSEPVKVINYSRHTARQMLSQGEHFIKLGAGISGNLIENTTDHTQQYFLYRFGLSDRLTLHFGSRSKTEQTPDFLTGVNLSIGKHWATGVDVAKLDNNHAATGYLFGTYENFTHHFNTRWKDDEFSSHWNAQWQYKTTIRPGIHARYKKLSDGTVEQHLLPSVIGNINNRVNYSALPNENGLYHFTAQYQGTAHRLRFSHYSGNSTSLQHSVATSQWSTLHLTAEKNKSPNRLLHVTTQFDWYPTGNYRNFLEVGISKSAVDSSAQITWNTYLKSGLEIQLQYKSKKIAQSERTENFWLRTRFNLVKSGRKYIPSLYRNLNLQQGSITGSIVDHNGDQIDLDNITVRLQGTPMHRIGTAGSFLINNLPPGIYNLSLDEDELPIEYVAKKSSVVAEVRASAVTHVDFTVNAFYGFAGRILNDNGSPLAFAPVVVTGVDNTFTSTANTDRFGYYRIDNIPPGEYTASPQKHPENSIIITVTNDFLFDQNITTKTEPKQHSDQSL